MRSAESRWYLIEIDKNQRRMIEQTIETKYLLAKHRLNELFNRVESTLVEQYFDSDCAPYYLWTHEISV